ncbi:Phloem protein 2-like a1 [Thalictrum thalictroides]|uniref:Phloem protein 2-like a1 n=1 Tax=Thalictrum thalictroides TaxID=46969 RepID=A0A7J6UWZ5_THATH|nr:Phloem protein 2-like a1 [Thalictrum thalictroides]
MGQGQSNELMGQGQPQDRATDINNIQEEESKLASKTIEVKPVPKLPYNYLNIIKEADLSIDFSSTEKLYEHLHHGVFLNQKRKKYWIDKESGQNCFMLYARNLSITWSEERHYWQWSNLIEASSCDGNIHVDVAQLLNVCWLEVHGKFNTCNLSPNTMYEILFIVMLNDPSYGWEVPVNIRLILPDGETKEHKETLLTRLRAQWIELDVGEFYTSPDKVGELQFSMFEYEGGKWKKGLCIKGVIIRPKK